MDAIRAVTVNAARQNFEEDRKGSLETGKVADLVVLSANPLEVAPAALADIVVEETFSGAARSTAARLTLRQPE